MTLGQKIDHFICGMIGIGFLVGIIAVLTIGFSKTNHAVRMYEQELNKDVLIEQLASRMK